MISPLRITAALAIGLSTLASVYADHYKLFVLTGQSNSLGTTNGGETDPTSGSDPADQHVKFFWDNFDTSNNSFGNSGGVFTTLQDQQGALDGGPYSTSDTHWGGEMEFGRTLYRAGVRNFGIIKASRGGGGNSNWLKPAGMYANVVNTVNAATTDLTNNGHTFEIVGLLYLQGESDSGSEITEAGTRLKTLTDNLRADLPNALALHTVAAGTTTAGAASMVNQKATADDPANTYIDFFDNTDLTVAPDGLHLNKDGKNNVGRRWAQAFLNAGIVDHHYGKLAFIGDSITQGGNGYPSYRYQVFKNLANSNVPQAASTGYEFVGSVTGAYINNAGATPDVNGQTFVNQHDGHYGWRAFWINARVALPGGRYNTNNLGQGTLENWLGTAIPDEFVTSNAGTLAYTGTNYTPDTVVMKIGINDLSDGTSATQVRDDISTLIDQLRADNANVRIHLCQVLYSNNVAFSKVDDVNALLPALVATKNAASSTSPVWLIDANNGFDPSTMTHDNTHPNTAGEEHVGDLISIGLGIIERPFTSPAPLEEKSSDKLGSLHFEGSDIYNSGSYASGWSATGDLANPTPTGADDLILDHPGVNADSLDGTNTGWNAINAGPWTFETRLNFTANPSGFILWLGTDTHRILIEIHGDRTLDFGDNSFNEEHNNLDGNFHTFTVKHDPVAGLYYVSRDGVLLNPGGSPYDQTGADSRLLLGDYTGVGPCDGFNVTIDYIEFYGGYNGDEIVTAVPTTQVLWRRDWESLASNTTITASNFDGGPRAASAEVGTQDFTVVSGTLRTWDGVVGGRDLISTSGSGVYEATVEITDVQYAAATEHILDFVIGTGSSGSLDGTWFVDFGTITGGVFTPLPSVDSGSASYNSGAITLNADENFMDNVNSSVLFGYNVGGRSQQLAVDATDAVNGKNIAIRFGVTSSNAFAGFTDMALSHVTEYTYPYVNNWGHGASHNPNPSLVNTDDIRIFNTSTTNGSWLDASGTNWADGNDGYWTLETRVKFDALPNGFTIWAGTGTQRVRVEIYEDRTQDLGAGTFSIGHDNADGVFHTFRIAHDPTNAVYHVWRDGARLTPVAGAGYDEPASDNRLFFGDYTDGTFGNGFDATIDYIRWDTGNSYLPVGADADLDGIPDLWEDKYFGSVDGATATNDDDKDGKNNLDEYTSDTNPTDNTSVLQPGEVTEVSAGNWKIVVPDTSAERQYTLKKSTDLGQVDPWTAVAGQGPTAGNGGNLEFTDITVDARSFYIVEVAVP